MVKGQQPGESDRQYMQRLQREAAQQKRERDAAIEQARAAEERAMDRAEQQSIDELQGIFGIDLDEIAEDAAKWGDGAWTKQIEEVSRLAKGSARQKRKALKKAKQHKGAIKAGHKQAKKAKKADDGCAVVAVLMVTVAGGAVWGLYEGASAIVLALGH